MRRDAIAVRHHCDNVCACLNLGKIRLGICTNTKPLVLSFLPPLPVIFTKLQPTSRIAKGKSVVADDSRCIGTLKKKGRGHNCFPLILRRGKLIKKCRGTKLQVILCSKKITGRSPLRFLGSVLVGI